MSSQGGQQVPTPDSPASVSRKVYEKVEEMPTAQTEGSTVGPTTTWTHQQLN